MAFTPSTAVRFLTVPLNPSERNQLSWADVDSQIAYFSSRIEMESLDCTYQRKDSMIRAPFHVDVLMKCNYVMYNNDNYGGKWFYAYIKNMEYVNNSQTNVWIETDAIQTWYFEMNLLQSYVLRMHHASHANGRLSKLEESFDPGEYCINEEFVTSELLDLWVVLATTVNPTNPTGGSLAGGLYNGIYSGVKYFAYNRTDYATLNNHINAIANAGKSDGIATIFMVPKVLLPAGIQSGDYLDTATAVAGTYNVPKNFSSNPANVSLDGYTPRNGKLLTYPYNFLYVSNGNGQCAILKYEHFNNSNLYNNFYFKIVGDISPNPTLRFIPMNYKGLELNTEEQITLTGYPLCSWHNSVYANWLAQTANQRQVTLNYASFQAGAGAGSAIGAALLGSYGGVQSGIKESMAGAERIESTLAQMKDRAIQPPQMHGVVGGGASNCAHNLQLFHIYHMSIRADIAMQIDAYLDMYGDKQNFLMVPQIRTRPAWNYVKTVDANITGEIPQTDLLKIKTIFDAGVTFWHNPAKVGDYTQNNYNT